MICRRYYTRHGINPMWIIKNSFSVHKIIASFNKKKNCKNIKTYDFSTLYTSIPHKKLLDKLKWVINKAFLSSNKKFISVYNSSASWTDSPRKNTRHLNSKEVIQLIKWLIDNTFVTLGDKCFKQKIGIPMDTDCAPLLANLFLYAYEYQWINKQVEKNKFNLLIKFKGCCRYIDDLLLINNDLSMEKVKSQIYPKEVILVSDDNNGLNTPFLDLMINIENSLITTHIYDKRDLFNFPIISFPILSGNIPLNSSYGVAVGEWVRYARACTLYKHFNSFQELYQLQSLMQNCKMVLSVISVTCTG